MLDEVKLEEVPAGAYTITVTQPAAGGTISASKSSSDGNETITVTVTPDSGYEIATVSYNDGSDHTITPSGGVYSFTMPGSNVTVTATFSKVDYAISTAVTTSAAETAGCAVWMNDGFTVIDNVATAQYGDVVKVQLHTVNGWMVDPTTPLTIVDASSNPVTATLYSSSDSNGPIYQFTMPASAVTITGNFVLYRQTVKLAGRYNTTSTSDWVNTNTGPQFTYDSTADSYTLDVFFATESSNFFYLFVDGTATWPTSGGNWTVTNTTGTATALTWNGGDGNEFAIAPGVYTITIAGDMSTIAFTKHEPTLTFSPASGSSVETGTTVSASSDLTTLIAAIDSNAAVTVGVNDDNGSTWNATYEFVTADIGSKTIYGKAYIGNIAVTGSATYTVTAVNNSTQYELVTDATDLVAGAKYLILNGSGNGTLKAIGTQTTGNNKPGVDISVADNIATATSEIGVFKLVSTEDSNYPWQFEGTFIESTSKYLAASSGDSNRLQYTTSDEDRTKASIAIASSGAATVIFNATRGYLYYNGTGTNTLFNCYGSAQTDTGYEQVRIYRQVEPGDYTITYATVTGGTLSGRSDANEGVVITVTATADTGYACTGISVSPSATVTDNGDGTYTFTMPAGNVTVTPTWAEAISITYVNRYYDINGDLNTGDTGGTVTGLDAAAYNTLVTPVITPANGYELQSLTYSWASGSSSADITELQSFGMPGTATTVTAVFALKPYTIAVVSANGQVTGVPATAVKGETVSFTVTPMAGYTITNVFYEYENNDATVQTAITANEGTYSFTMPAKDVTIRVGYFAGDEYELLTDVHDIKAGETYLIVGGAASGDYVPTHVMGTTLANTRLNAVGLTSETYDSSTGIISSSSLMNLVDFVAGTGDNAGKWAIHTSDGYLYSTSSGSLQRGSTPYYATISVDNSDHDRATIELVSGSYKLSFNSNSPMFRFYSTQQGAAYIYKLHESNKVKKPTISGAAGQYIGLYNFIGTDQVTLACATDGSTIEYSLDGGTTWTAYSEPFALSQTALGGTVTVTARATKTDMEGSDEVSATFTCIKPTWHTKPCGDNWDCDDQEYNNPVFIYPNGSLANRNAYGKANIRFFYTLDGTTPTMSSAEVPTPSSGEKFIFLDSDVELTVIPVINDIAGDPVSGIITFTAAAPEASLAAGSYDGDQQTRLTTTTASKLNNTDWTTRIWYALETTSYTPPTFAFDSSTGEVTSSGWQLYDASTAPYIDILVANGDIQVLHSVTLTNFYGGTFTGQYSGAAVHLNSTGTWIASATTETTYMLTAANLDVVFSPAGGTYLYTKNVTLTPQNAVGTVTMTYDIVWSDPDATHVDATGVTYTGAITVDREASITVHAADERSGDGGTYTKTHTYKIGVQQPMFSPLPSSYNTGIVSGADGSTDWIVYYEQNRDRTVEIFTVSPGAQIYYTSTHAATYAALTEPAAPSKSSGTLYTGNVAMEEGFTRVKAIAYVGSMASTVREIVYQVVKETDTNDEYWYCVQDMNEDATGTTKTFRNPIEVIYMNTFRNDGSTPEFAFVRDNSGYGYIYFGKNATSKQSWRKYQPGDWIKGGTITGTATVWSESYINELDMQSQSDNTAWNAGLLANRPLVPETTTCRDIRDGWGYPNGTFTGDAYANASTTSAAYAGYVTGQNIFGHYVHLRKNTITGVTGAGAGSAKHAGTITGELGVPLCYYDGLYLYSGYNGSSDYDQTFFDQIQNKGGTFAVYAIVYFYGPYAKNSTWNNAPYEVFPIDFEYIFPPIFNLADDATASDMTNHTPERTIYEATTLTLTCDTRGAQIWYKTSDMEDFRIYAGEQIPVTKSMTVETYSTHSTDKFDELQSINRVLTINMGEIEQPVISPESSMQAVGSSAVSVTIACETVGATIWYTTDGSDPSDDSNENRMEYTGGFSVSETTTVRAIAEEDGYYSREAEQRTYTFVKSNGIVYSLVTGVSELNANSVYVIVNKAESMSLTRTQKANNRDDAPVLFLQSGDTGYRGEYLDVFGNDDLAVFTMRQIGDNWYVHTANGSTNSSTGFIYGKTSGSTNQLLTDVNTDPNAVSGHSIEWSIEIDADGTAHMINMYSEQPRYLRYNKSFNLFNTYSSETAGLPVYIYKKEATPLANIEMFGTTGTTYTISDELVGVYANGTKLWAKDQGNVSITKRENLEGWEDYVAALYPNAANADEWDQSNWVILDFTNLEDAEDEAQSFVGKFIYPATVTGRYTDDVNYTIELQSLPTPSSSSNLVYSTDVNSTAANVVTMANFNDEYTGDNGAVVSNLGRTFFFVRPKSQEVVLVTNATWSDGMFVIPAKSGDKTNGADLSGAVSVDWTLCGDRSDAIESHLAQSGNEDNELTFLAVVKVKTGGSQAPRRAPKTGLSETSTLELQPTAITLPTTPTSVNDLTGTREVKRVQYVDVVGRTSDRPFDGMNIIVTEYTDGSVSTVKVLK